MTAESPYSNEYIEDMLNRKLATRLWPEAPEEVDESKDWIYESLGDLRLAHFENRFLEAVSAGHTVADAARAAGKNPQWGLDFLARLAKVCEYRG